MRPVLSCPLLLPHCCHCCHDMRTFPDLQLPFAPPTPLGALVRRAATLTLSGQKLHGWFLYRSQGKVALRRGSAASHRQNMTSSCTYCRINRPHCKRASTQMNVEALACERFSEA
jgi:hypothetical protein